MLRGIRTIYFSTDLQYPPQMEVKKDKIRELYRKLAEPGGYAYENLDLQATHPTMSTRRENGLSQCQIGGGRIRIEESDPAAAGMTVEDFVGTVKTVLGALPEGGAPFFFSQRCLIRCTVQPAKCDDSLALLAGNVARVLDAIGPFERPPSFFGVRFRFVPSALTEDKDAAATAEKTDETPENPPKKTKKSRKKEPIVHRGFVTLRFETYSRDIKQVWMEADAQYVEDVIDIHSHEKIAQNIRDTSLFVTENAKKFLDQFDNSSGEDDAAGEK